MFRSSCYIAAVLVLLSAESGEAETGPKGMYCGGNEIVQSVDPLRATTLSGVVLDAVGASEIPTAKVQIQRQGSDAILLEIHADDHGRFRLPKLPTGAYWLGISHPGYNLHVWDIRIVRFGRAKKLNAKLSLGT